MKRTVLAVISAFALSLASSAHAAPITIVDTGPASGPFNWDLGTSVVDSAEVWLAAEFDVSAPVMVTSVEGWISPVISGDVAFSIYSDGGEWPGVLLHSSVVTLAAAVGPSWLGATGLGWVLAPGTYWVTYETPAASTFSGSMPSSSGSPLGNEAFQVHNGPYPLWSEDDSIDLGVRILGDDEITSVPEPASLLLVGSGLLGLYVHRRR